MDEQRLHKKRVREAERDKPERDALEPELPDRVAGAGLVTKGGESHG